MTDVQIGIWVLSTLALLIAWRIEAGVNELKRILAAIHDLTREVKSRPVTSGRPN